MDVSERMSAALQRFDEALQAAGHPLPDLLEPGLTDERIAELMAPTGLRLPDEAVVLWRWHNGATTDPERLRDAPAGGNALAGIAWLLPLDEAVADWQRSYDLRDWPVTADLTPEWFPMATFGSEGYLWFDCSVGLGAPAPIRWVDTWESAPADVAAARTAPSLAAAFDALTDLLTAGLWRRIDPDEFPAMTEAEFGLVGGAPEDSWVHTWPWL